MGVLPALTEPVVGQHAQEVAYPQPHLTELGADALAGAVDGEHRPPVTPAEADRLEGAARQRRPFSDYHLVRRAGAAADDREMSLLGRNEAGDALEVEHT